MRSFNKYVPVLPLAFFLLACNGDRENTVEQIEVEDIDIRGGWTSVSATKTVNGEPQEYDEDVQLYFYDDYLLNMSYPCEGIKINYQFTGDTLIYPELDQEYTVKMQGDTLTLANYKNTNNISQQMQFIRADFPDSTLKKMDGNHGINFGCLKGNWILKQEDRYALESPYVGDLPLEFQLDSVEQVGEYVFEVNTIKGPYDFFLVEYFADSSMLVLHPTICKCEAFDLRYLKY